MVVGFWFMSASVLQNCVPWAAPFFYLCRPECVVIVVTVIFGWYYFLREPNLGPSSWNSAVSPILVRPANASMVLEVWVVNPVPYPERTFGSDL